jgi:hypothetical protein
VFANKNVRYSMFGLVYFAQGAITSYTDPLQKGLPSSPLFRRPGNRSM